MVNYKVGDLITYGEVSDPDLACVGLIVKVYWDGSVNVLDPYALDEGREEYHIIESDEILETLPSRLEKLVINTFTKIMPLEFWTLGTLWVGTIVCILIEIIRRVI